MTLLFLISQLGIIIVLGSVTVVFTVLLILGILKSHKLQKENERLDKLGEEITKPDEKYRDFTEGHLYN